MKKFFTFGLVPILSVVIFSCGSSPKDVYVSGSYNDTTSGKEIACYWKNGAKVDVGAMTEDSEAYGIFVSGTDVYVAGRVYASPDTATYWKNGTKVILG